MKWRFCTVALSAIILTLVACQAVPTAPVITAIPSETVEPPTLSPATLVPTASPSATSIPSTKTPPPPKILRIGHLDYPDTLDPQKASSWAEIEVLRFVYDGLLNVDDKGNILPAGADQWIFSSQGNQLTLHIRSGLKRSDGTAITAKDYEYALKREIDPRVPDRWYSALLYDVKGAYDLDNTDTKKTKPEAIDKALSDFGVSAPNDSTLVITFAAPVAFWNYIGSTWITFPADKRQVDRDPDAWWTRPEGHNGSGPFKIKSIDRGRRIVLERNENHWRGNATLDQIELLYYPDAKSLLEAYQRGDIDIDTNVTVEDAAKIAGDSRTKGDLLRGPRALTSGFAFNLSKKPFTDISVRRAFSAAVDRARYVREILGDAGKPYARWIPPGVPGSSSDQPGLPTYNPDAAVKYLVDNGYAAKDSTTEQPKVDCAKLGEIKLTYPYVPKAQKRVEFLSTNLNSVFKCPITLEAVEPSTYENLMKDVKTAPQLAYHSWMGDYPHPEDWLSLYWNCGTIAARFGYCNREFDALTQKADREFDPQESMRLYRQAESVLLADVPSIFLNYSESLFLIKPYVIGPREHTAPADMQWPGEWGPFWSYDIDLNKLSQTNSGS